MRILMNLHSAMKNATHLRLVRRIPEVVLMPEASRWRWTMTEIIGVPEVLHSMMW
jgi:aminoglycoside phosphotransferase